MGKSQKATGKNITATDTQNTVTRDEIQKRAYEIYTERQKKGIEGDNDSDWRIAEAELRNRVNRHLNRKQALVTDPRDKNRVGRFLSTVVAIGLITLTAVVLRMKTRNPAPKISHSYVLDISVGDVYLSHDQRTNWLAVEPGMTINQNDIIKTKQDSYCDIIMTGRGIFRILEQSEIHIGQLSGNLENLKMVKGKIAMNVTKKLKKDEIFMVETDVAVASVRGTRFFIEKEEDGINAVLLEGTINLKRNLKFSASEEIKSILEEGMEIKISSNQIFSVKNEDNIKLSRELTSNFQNVEDITQAKKYTEQYQSAEAEKIRKIENPEIYTEVMNKINTPERLNKIDAKVSVSTINFESGQEGLSEVSIAELNKLILLYKQSPKIKIEVQGHTDSEGDFSENLKLSKNRADSVRYYLIKNGISREDITANGYGDSQPIADNRTETGKKLNRRTEIKVYTY